MTTFTKRLKRFNCLIFEFLFAKKSVNTVHDEHLFTLAFYTARSSFPIKQGVISKLDCLKNRVGQWVLFIGDPLYLVQITLSSNLVSRNVTLTNSWRFLAQE